MRLYSVFRPKKTKYRLFWMWLGAFLILTFLNLFIREDFIISEKENLFYKLFGVSFVVLVMYYGWKEYADSMHSEKITEEELHRELEKLDKVK